MALQKELTTYIALFHHRDNAASAIRDLEASDFTRNIITVIGGGNGSAYSEAKGSFGDGHRYGNESVLAEIGTPEADRRHLQDGLAHGGVVLALEGFGERADEIERIFAKHSTKKINEAGVENAPYFARVDAGTLPAMKLDEKVGVRVFRRILEEPISPREEKVVIDRRPAKEIRVGNASTEHVESIRDTVRRTEVDVEQFGSIARSDLDKKY